MKDSSKTLLASLIIFACSLGFFIGAFAFNNSGSSCCQRNADFCPKMAPCGPDFQGPQCKRHHDGEFRGEFRGEHPRGEHFRGEPPRGPHFEGKDFKKGKHFDKQFNPEKGFAFMDSVLQVTKEQKAAIEQQRNKMDSAFKVLRKQKKEAEIALHKALDSNDDKKIAAAKANLLKAQESLLNNRINGVKGLNSILTKEQQEKVRALQPKPNKKDRDNRDNEPEPPQD